jgi:hypothetical protein
LSPSLILEDDDGDDDGGDGDVLFLKATPTISRLDPTQPSCVLNK